jgi:type VI secretion system protein ImpH
MAAEGWMEESRVRLGALEESLEREPYSFEFFQAVRLLQQLRPNATRVGSWGNPDEEAVHFGATPTTAFPASEIQAIEKNGDLPARMMVNFFGLTGPQGVLPLEYSELVAERVRQRDHSLRDFLDLFNHRFLSLFFRAWERTHALGGDPATGRDPLRDHLLDLAGMGTSGLADQLGLPPASLPFYVGLLAMPTRPAVALELLLEDYFGVPVDVEQFVGGWYAIDEASQCALGDESSASAQLGFGAVAGDEIWDLQARARLRLGPLTRAQYDTFLPTGRAYEELRALTKFFTGEQVDIELQLVLARDEVPPVSLGTDSVGPTPLGWCTWLRSRPFTRDASDTILTL